MIWVKLSILCLKSSEERASARTSGFLRAQEIVEPGRLKFEGSRSQGKGCFLISYSRFPQICSLKPFCLTMRPLIHQKCDCLLRQGDRWSSGQFSYIPWVYYSNTLRPKFPLVGIQNLISRRIWNGLREHINKFKGFSISKAETPLSVLFFNSDYVQPHCLIKSSTMTSTDYIYTKKWQKIELLQIYNVCPIKKILISN